MLRRSLLIGTMACLTGTARAAGNLPYGPAHTFAAYRNGQKIGSHALAFAINGADCTITTSIDFAVRALGFVVYRYRHLCRETWSSARFTALASQTDDDGVTCAVEAHAGNGGLAVRTRASKAIVKTSGDGDEALQPGGWLSKQLPPGLMPSTHWNIEQVRQSALLNSQTGKLAAVAIAPGARETVRTAGGSLPASRYTYSGDVRMTQWFDDRGRWVKSSFQVFDGSTIEYILQE